MVATYAKEWEKYKAASGYSNRVCEYLNKVLTKPDDGSTAGTTAFALENFGDLKFKRQTVESVKHSPFCWNT
jgi:hypothetical protein